MSDLPEDRFGVHDDTLDDDDVGQTARLDSPDPPFETESEGAVGGRAGDGLQRAEAEVLHEQFELPGVPVAVRSQ